MATQKFCRVLPALLLVPFLYGCQTSSQTSSGSEGSPGIPSPSGVPPSSSIPSPTSTPSPTGLPSPPSTDSGSDNSTSTSDGDSSSNSSGSSSPGIPSPSSGVPWPGESGGSRGAGDKRKGSQTGSGDSGSEQGAQAEWEVLDEALEEFEQAGGGVGEPSFENGDDPTGLPGENNEDGSLDGEESSGARTGSERTAELDRELEESYGTFETAILRERDHVKGRSNQQGSVASDDVEDDPLGDLEGEIITDSGDLGGDSGSSVEGAMPDRPDGREGDFDQEALAKKVPDDIPDGSDDDVVARQLREAATAERDPELREKLWDEYRKYKEGQG